LKSAFSHLAGDSVGYDLGNGDLRDVPRIAERWLLRTCVADTLMAIVYHINGPLAAEYG
jgi:hypothetical protein